MRFNVRGFSRYYIPVNLLTVYKRLGEQTARLCCVVPSRKSQKLDNLDVEARRMVQEKPCRTCTDFKTWAAIQKRTYDSEKSSGKEDDKSASLGSSSSSARENCPLDKDELGSKTWAFLHTMAAYYPDNPTSAQKKDMKTFFDVFSKFYPCNTCAEDLQVQLKKTPPLTDSQDQLSQWLCSVHNEVNKKVGKPVFDCTLVNQRWRDGWLDGSCD